MYNYKMLYTTGLIKYELFACCYEFNLNAKLICRIEEDKFGIRV